MNRRQHPSEPGLEGAEVLEDALVDERIDGEHQALLRRQELALPARGEAPPLAVERTTLPEGPTLPPVILVHGFAQNRLTWRVSRRSMAGRLAEEGFEVLNLELRGHGGSRRLGSGPARCFDDYVDDLARVAGACRERPFVVGHSLGGGVCVGAATRAELAGVVHIAGVYAFATRNRTIRALARLSLQLEPALARSRVRMSTGWAGQLVAQLYQLADVAGYGFPLAGWAPGSMERDLLEERLARGFDWTSVEVWLQMCRWARGEPFPYAESFRERDVPLLVMAGNADPLLHPDDARQCYENSGSSDRSFVVFEPFEHQVHWGHLDLLLGRHAPGIVWPRLVGWLRDRA